MDIGKVMDALQDKLLEHVIPDQEGSVGKIEYRLSEMKIVHVHWPKVYNADGTFWATNGALRLQGKYHIRRPGLFGYNKSGEFVFDLGAICLSITDENNQTVSSTTACNGHSRRHHRRRNGREVTCNVGHIKIKFHGGAAMICQFATSLYIKMYRQHLERQISEAIQENIRDDEQLVVSALTVMAAMHGSNNTDETQHPVTAPAEQSSSTSTQHRGRFHRFFHGLRFGANQT